MTSTARRLFVYALLALASLGFGTTTAFAQGSSTSQISGTVVDTSGATVPGADITAVDNATGTKFSAVSTDTGAFTIPAVPTGTYTVTVALSGFKTAVLKDVQVSTSGPAVVKATLQVGGLEETVTVGAASEIVQTQSTAVAQTLNARQIANLPVPGRAAFDLVSYMPGVTSSDGTIRGSTVNGLPQSAVNITLDGMNIQDNYLKTSDGMFARVSPRLDAVEEVTVATASQGADMAGQGAVQVKFVTRSGTNKFAGSGYYYLRRDWMNTNTWFNLHRNVDAAGKPLSKPVLSQYQPGFRIGGPVLIPGLYDGRDKAFFFVNYEELRSPGSITNNRTIMSPLSEQGQFQYSGGAIDLMALAAKNGQIARIDPIVAKLLADIRSTTGQGTLSATTDPLTQTFAWQAATKNNTTYPTVRLDYNVTSKHRASFTTTRNHILSDPDTTNSRQPAFPGFPVHGLQDSQRYSGQGSLRSTLTSSLVNEARFGATGGATKFSPDLATSMFGATSIADMHGYDIRWNAFKSIQSPGVQNAPSAREGKTRVFEDTLNWIKGSHAVSTGVSYTRAGVWLYNQQLVPQITLGVPSTVSYSGDPADSMFTTANFPGASATDLSNAKNLYYVLTGRISQISREARIGGDGNYSVLGASNQYGRLPQWGTFVQDSWRWKPNLTINGGLRYDVQQPFYSLNDSYSRATMADILGVTGTGSGFVPGSTVTGLGNLFKPGVIQGSPTTFKQLPKGTKAYNTDWKDIAPSIGVAWTIGSDHGWEHSILGKEGNSVLRAGFSRAYQRGGMSDFTGVFGGNPGIAIDATRTQTNNNLGTVPLLLTGGDLSAPAVPSTRTFPLAVPNASSNVFAFDPNIKTPYGNSISAGWQRGLTKDMSIEARYIYTKSVGTWTINNVNGYLNYNELNIVENHFVDEFRVAQANLVANIAAGKGNTFAYTGAAGTSPLPIFLAYLNGSNAAGDSSKYTGSGWTNSTTVQSLFGLNPNPFVAANQIRTNAGFLANGTAAGMPSNFWVANPDVSQANVVANGPDTHYNGIQLVLNRRFARGLLFQSNYTYGKGYQQQFYSFHKPYVETEENFSNSGNGSATGNIRHVWSTNWVYELPFGRGKRFGAEANGVVQRVIGNWNFEGVARLQSGRMVDFGDVRLVGMSADDLRRAFKPRLVTDPANPFRTLVYLLPQDIIDNTVKAFSVSATGYSSGAPSGRYMAPANGPDCLETAQASINNPTTGFGTCGVRSLIVTGPKVVRFDMSLVKQIPISRGVNLEAQLQVFNVFNRVNFTPVTGFNTTSNTYGVADSYQVTAAVDQSRTMQMAFRIQF
jgi:Carboxypeptidase regulatory-like domain